MEIEQKILDRFMVRKDYIEWIEKETAIFVYFDFTNMLHWQDTLGWKFRIEDIVSQLQSYPNVKEIKVYYGFNGRDKETNEVYSKKYKRWNVFSTSYAHFI